MMLSRLDLEAQYLGPLFQMADPIGPLLDKDEEALSPSSSLEATAPASPSLSISSYSLSRSPYQTLSSPTSSVSPPPTASLLGTKARADPLSLPWLGAPAGDDEGDTFEDMDWISEKIDLSGLDLHSLIDSCSSGESPSSPEDLLASLDSQMDLDFGALGTTGSVLQQSLELGLPLPAIPSFPLELPGAAGTKMAEEAPRQEVVLKSEPPSPAPSPAPPSPVYPLELGSEVDVLEAEKVATSLTATIIPDPSGSGRTTDIVVSLPSSGHIVLVLTNQKEPSLLSLSGQSSRVPPPPSDCDSDSGIESITSSPTRPPSPPHTPSPSAGSSRTKPYSKPDPTAASPSAKSSRIKSASSPPKVVEKKLKKMEQNKTAATRYRQKKRVEQELMSTELQGLEDRNHELAEKAESISREIQYLKDLMEEVRKHRLGKSCSGA